MSNGGQNMEYEYKEKKRSWFFGLPLSFTTYTVSQKKINIKKGLLRTEEDDTLMYKIQDVKLVRSLWERIFKLGTVICYSGDVTDAKLMLTHIKNSSEIKEYILETAEEGAKKSPYSTHNGLRRNGRSVSGCR